MDWRRGEELRAAPKALRFAALKTLVEHPQVVLNVHVVSQPDLAQLSDHVLGVFHQGPNDIDVQKVKGSVPHDVNLQVLLACLEDLSDDLDVFLMHDRASRLRQHVPLMVVRLLYPVDQFNQLDHALFWNVAHLVLFVDLLWLSVFGAFSSCGFVLPWHQALELAPERGQVQVLLEHSLQVNLDLALKPLDDLVVQVDFEQTLEVALFHASRLKRLVDGLLKDVFVGPVVDLVDALTDEQLLHDDVLLVEKDGTDLLYHGVVREFSLGKVHFRLWSECRRLSEGCRTAAGRKRHHCHPGHGHARPKTRLDEETRLLGITRAALTSAIVEKQPVHFL